MAYGDHIYVNRVGYTHHGIDCGDGTVIHYDGGLWHHDNACIKRSPLEEFAKEGEIQIMEYGESFPPTQVVQRAASRVGENDYDLFENNCEHFARWCKTNQATSEQVENSRSITDGIFKGVTAMAAGIGLINKGIMRSGVTVSTIPTLATQATLEKILKDDDTLSEEERQARAMARTITNLSALASTVGALGVVSASGTVAGLITAGIEAGLTAIGASVGGGVTTGTVITATAPALLTLAAGYGTYRWWKKR